MSSRWPFIGRTPERIRIESLLAAGTGAVVLGPAGIGKSALVQHLADGHPEPARIYVAGHAVSNNAPYEAFAGVLVGADRELLPVEVARRVIETLPATPALFIVDDAHLLDDRSAQVLLQLSAGRSVTVLATAHDVSLPVAIERLWRDGWCERLHLDGLSEDETAELIETVLDGPLERESLLAFGRRAQGNPLVLRELVSAAIDSGALVRSGPGWRLAGDPPLSHGLRELVRSRLAGLPAAERAALEAIAAGEPLPLAVAAELVGEAQLDALDAARLVAIRAGLAGPEISTAHPLHGEVLRADLPPLRLHRLRLSVAGKLESSVAPSPHDLVRSALWRLDGGQPADPERLLAAARAARALSLETAERLARSAHERSASLPATLLLAEILTHTGRGAEATALTRALPPDTLDAADREALVYCTVVGEGLLAGDPGGGAELVAGVLAGVPAATDQLRALYASLLAFDARSEDSLAVAQPLLDDPGTTAPARTLAAVGAVGAQYWLGQSRAAVALADEIAPVARAVRAELPFAAASIELIAICALLDEAELDRAESRARAMARQAAADHDPFSGPRSEYCLARVELVRGRPDSAQRRFQRALAALGPFDQFSLRHITGLLARAAAGAGDLVAARSALQSCADAPRMTTYEPEFELCVAAVLAAELRLSEAAEHAAWAAGVAADRALWNTAIAGYHDAARYGAARTVRLPMREAVPHQDGTFAWSLLDHVSALGGGDAEALTEVARRFETQGALALAAEAAAEAALAQHTGGRPRAARASAARAAAIQARCEGELPPWLVGAGLVVPLTSRERQIAVLAARGRSDADIAARLGISVRTVQTHLGRVYDKLGISSRTRLGPALARPGADDERG